MDASSRFTVLSPQESAPVIRGTVQQAQQAKIEFVISGKRDILWHNSVKAQLLKPILSFIRA
jgi:hypothetical protein